MKKFRFRFLTGDVNFTDYGGKWWRSVGDRRFHVLELSNMDDLCGKDNAGQPPYLLELTEVDLDTADLEGALRSCGFVQRDGAIVNEYDGAIVAEGKDVDAVLVEAVHGYGQKAPLHSVASRNWRRAFAEARRESYLLTKDAERYERVMERPVNRIGSTAREYQAGDIDSAILRGLDEGRPEAELMARIGMLGRRR